MMRRHSLSHWISVCLLTAMSTVQAGASEVRGELAWPEEWVAFAPAERDMAPPTDPLKPIPERIRRRDGILLEARPLRAPRGERIDLQFCFREQRIGNTAWLYTTLHSASNQTATIGMGADWWFTAWLNGREILATPEAGNHVWPPTPADFTTNVSLHAGENVLAVRVVTGSASALFAAGGPAEIRAARGRIGGAEDPMRFNRPVPFAQRSPFAAERQAFAAADMEVTLPAAESDLAAGALVGLRKLPKRQLHLAELYGRPEVHDTEYRRFPFDPVKLRLSKRTYPAEDLHLDVLLWTSPPEDIPHTGSLEIILKDGSGRELARHPLAEVSDTGWFFSIGLPPRLTGTRGQLEAIWRQDDVEIGRATAWFRVRPPTGVAKTGRIPVRILNAPGATLRAAPMTVGVPFPQGALHDEAHVRLVDEAGRDVPLQTRITARWSRFGAVKWLLCDFTADLAGAPREWFIEYGPAIQRTDHPPLAVTPADAGVPGLDTGRIRIGEDGLAFDPDGSGTYQPVLGPGALRGEFVVDADGTRFGVPRDVRHVVEELGSEKAVIRRTGWYRAGDATGPPGAPDGGERFCNFVTRLVFHRDSPVVRIYHTWIFTGDGNRDRIRSMGWRFDSAGELTPQGFLTSFTNTTWAGGDRLVQFDYHAFQLADTDVRHAGRTPGVLSARIGNVRVLFGAKDFWQNFPSELEFTSGAFVFYNWPRHNPPAYTPHPVPAAKAFQLRYAHEGERLDFTTPEEYLDGPIWKASSIDGRDVVWPRGDREAINAQGVARTEELFLYFSDPAAPREEAVRVLRGLNDESLRAVVDPVWMAASGAFDRIHHQDRRNYPQAEALYEQICHAPARWNERLGAYGMWVHGDFPVDGANLREQTASPRRTWKKGHHGWPYKWTPFARSGDPRLFKYAEAGSRQMIDGNFRHFADTNIAPRQASGQGWTGTSLFPWLRSGNRSISQDVDYLWHNWYIAGFQRTRDVALLWMELAKRDTSRCLPGRISVSQLYYYLDSYMATFDPWFLIAAQEIAKLHLEVWDGPLPDRLATDTVGHFWKPAEYNYYRFTGDEDHKRLATRIAMTWASPWGYTRSWQRLDVPFIEESAAAWFLTGDEYYLARVTAFMDKAAIQVFDGPEPEYLRGSNLRSGGAGTTLELFTGWYIQHFPLGLYALEAAGKRPDPVPEPFFQRPATYETVEADGRKLDRVRPPAVWIKKNDADAIPLFLDTWRYQDLVYDYRVTGTGDREVLSGEWTAKSLLRTELPAGTPAGLYRLSMEALEPHVEWRGTASQFVSGLIRMPATPAQVPEVIAFERTEAGTHVGPSLYESQYWFRVPDGTTEFWIRFAGGGAKIWNPDREVVWDAWRQPPDTETPQGPALVRVLPNQAGKLWRITRGGAQQGFVVDPRIPPYFSASRAKWFDPESASQ